MMLMMYRLRCRRRRCLLVSYVGINFSFCAFSLASILSLAAMVGAVFMPYTYIKVIKVLSSTVAGLSEEF